jgi:hypothetical protein
MAVALGVTAFVGFALMMGGIFWGGPADIQTDLASIKAAWRSGQFREDPIWMRVTVVAGGAALMGIGLFGVWIVLGPPIIKLLCAAAIVYPAVRFAMAWRKF